MLMQGRVAGATPHNIQNAIFRFVGLDGAYCKEDFRVDSPFIYFKLGQPKTVGLSDLIK